MAKGLSSGYLPISAVGVAGHIVEALRDAGGDFIHGFTYSGHPTCAAVALKNIEIIEREDLVRRTREETGPHLARNLQALADHPLVGQARSLGLIGALEIVSRPGTRERFSGDGAAARLIRDLCIENGLMVRAVRRQPRHEPPAHHLHQSDRHFNFDYSPIIGSSASGATTLNRALSGARSRRA